MTLTACGQATKVQVQKIKAEIPGPPECIEKRFPVEFAKCEDKYCLDFQNAKNLLLNVKLDRQCLEKFKEWSDEVCKNEDVICH